MFAAYDLVILGGAREGRLAAKQAAIWGARVALLEPPGLYWQHQRQALLLQVLRRLGESTQQQQVSRWFEENPSGEWTDKGQPDWDWQTVKQWCAMAAETESPDLSVTSLSYLGVDVVLETPQRLLLPSARWPWHRKRRPVVKTASREITARGVLCAYGRSPGGIAPLLNAKDWPERIVIQGGSPEAVVWAEVLALVGCEVRIQTDELLLGWAQVVREGVRSRLSMLGVTFESRDAAAHEIQQTSAHSECVLPIDHQPLALRLPIEAYKRLNTGSSDLPRVAYTNAQMRLGHSRVFACGPAVTRPGTYGQAIFSQLTNAQIQVALWNALFWSGRRIIDHDLLPQAYSNFARLGLTVKQAIARYKQHRVQTYTAHYPNSADLKRPSPSPVVCQLVCDAHFLRGVHLCGPSAASYIARFAGSIDLPVSQVIDAVCIDDDPMGKAIQSTFEQYRQAAWKIGRWRRDSAENWFNWRRTR